MNIHTKAPTNPDEIDIVYDRNRYEQIGRVFVRQNLLPAITKALRNEGVINGQSGLSETEADIVYAVAFNILACFEGEKTFQAATAQYRSPLMFTDDAANAAQAVALRHGVLHGDVLEQELQALTASLQGPDDLEH